MIQFLNPWFLAAALLAAGPVVFHLMRRNPRRRVVFSSLMFLDPTAVAVSRSRRPEHWLLLLLRCAVVGLLAAAFARPFFPGLGATTRPSRSRMHMLVLDVSASMRRSPVWNEARDRIDAFLDSISESDRVGVMTFDRGGRMLMDFREWDRTPPGERRSLLRERLAGVSPGWGATALDAGLARAVEAYRAARMDPESEPTEAGGRIYVITDLQEGSRRNGLQSLDWPAGFHVEIAAVGPASPSNAGLQFLTSTGISIREDPGVRLKVWNDGSTGVQSFQVALATAEGTALETRELRLGSGESRLLTESEVPAEVATLTGDAIDFDNKAFRYATSSELIPVWYFGEAASGDPDGLRYYLEAAIPDHAGNARLDLRSGREALDDLGNHPPSLLLVDGLARNRAYLREIKALLDEDHWLATVIMQAGDRPQDLAELLPGAGLRIEEARVSDHARLGWIDFDHPLFSPFSDARFSDFAGIHIWSYRRVVPAAGGEAVETIARLDSRDPAVLHFPGKRGSVLLFTFGWRPEESQLTLSSKFVPLLYRMVEFTGALNRERTDFEVGDLVAFPESMAGGEVTVYGPDGGKQVVPAGQGFRATDVPGIYRAEAQGQTFGFTVNLAASESALTPLRPEELGNLGTPIETIGKATVGAESAKINQEELHSKLEKQQKVWKWVILAIVGILIAETWLAGRVTRRAIQTKSS